MPQRIFTHNITYIYSRFCFLRLSFIFIHWKCNCISAHFNALLKHVQHKIIFHWYGMFPGHVEEGDVFLLPDNRHRKLGLQSRLVKARKRPPSFYCFKLCRSKISEKQNDDKKKWSELTYKFFSFFLTNFNPTFFRYCFLSTLIDKTPFRPWLPVYHGRQ